MGVSSGRAVPAQPHADLMHYELRHAPGLLKGDFLFSYVKQRKAAFACLR